MALRPNKSVSSSEILRQKFKNSTPPPYGYCYLEGRLQKDPREYPVLQIIDQQRQMGKSTSFIAKYLNGRNLRPRKGKAWQERTIYKIVQRLIQPANSGSLQPEDQT